MWTMDELVERVREALAAEYPGAPNGRVRDVPDRRAIRWYTTIGLVDRPLGMRGRTALYGPRHLEQLVAIKRWQAEGRSLAEIQADFIRLTPEALSEASRVPDYLLADNAPKMTPDVIHRPRFWSAEPAAADVALTEPAATELAPADLAATEPVGAPLTIPASALSETVDSVTSTVPPARPLYASEPPDPAGQQLPTSATPIHGLMLGGGAILLLPRPLTDDDRAQIAAAAAPLLSLLDSRGLIDRRMP